MSNNLSGLGLQTFEGSQRPFGPLPPGLITSATVLAKYESPESISIASFPFATGTAPPALSLTGNLAQALGLVITVATTGAPGTAKVNISVDNGGHQIETNVSTTPGTHPIASTGLNLVFPSGGGLNYAANDVYNGVCSPFRDLVGINDFVNTTSGQRPTILVAGQGGEPQLVFTGTPMVLNVPGTLAQSAAGGTNGAFTVLVVATVNAVPVGVNVATVMTLGNSGTPTRVDLQYSATHHMLRRHDDSGNDVLLQSNIPPTGGIYMWDARFDGTNVTVACLGADVIGGKSDVSGKCDLPGTLTLNNVSLGAQKTNGATGSYASFSVQAVLICSGKVSDEEIARVRQFYAQKYGFKIFRNRDVMNTVTMFCGATKGTAAEHWWGTLMLPADDSNGNNTDFGYRQPLRLDGVTPYWYYQGTGDPPNEQAIVDEHIIMMSDAGIKAVVPLYYTRPQDVPSNQGIPAQVVLWHWFDLYNVSRYKSRLKFAVMCVSTFASFDANSGPQPQFPIHPGTWLNLPTMAAYWASLMLDPQYLKDKDGNPFFYPYNDPTTPWDATHLAVITSAAQAVGFSAVTFVNPNETAAIAPGIQITSYGPNGAGLPGTTQNPYQSQIVKDRSNWLISLGNRKQLGITPINDGRASRGLGTYWVERHTYTEIENHLEQSYAYARITRNQVPDQATSSYSVGEWTEGGDSWWTRETKNLGVNTPTRGIFFDAYHNVNLEEYPTEWWDWYRADSKASGFSRTGTWTSVFPVTNGGGSNSFPFEFTVVRATAAATLTFNSANFAIPSNAPRDGFQIYGTLFPGGGSFSVSVNGGPPTTVSQAAGSTSYGNLLFDSGALPSGPLVVVVSWVSGTVELDRIGAHRQR